MTIMVRYVQIFLRRIIAAPRFLPRQANIAKGKLLISYYIIPFLSGQVGKQKIVGLLFRLEQGMIEAHSNREKRQ